ncbi:GAF domain-containing protein [Kutzneria sp. CA-103260]|uniref:GAF domain-containing protein n=1 Tax=Kutzneria sp. CA-103260 TaxID=2802641 RepID=UPI001BA7AB96|nr:GAF domain-containing protein [Kutzneria sp. CA-103260]
MAFSHVCRACASWLDIDGVSLCLPGDLGPAEPMYATDAVSAYVAELEITLGEGPGVEALRTSDAVLAEDLTDSHSLRRWPVLAPTAVPAGALALYALPLTAGGPAVGVLELYRAGPHVLAGQQLADAQLFADAALAIMVNDAESGRNRWPGVLDGPFAARWMRIYEAVGTVAAQLETSLVEAYLSLRARAFATDSALGRLAELVVSGEVRFTPDARGGDTR